MACALAWSGIGMPNAASRARRWALGWARPRSGGGAGHYRSTRGRLRRPGYSTTSMISIARRWYWTRRRAASSARAPRRSLRRVLPTAEQGS